MLLYDNLEINREGHLTIGGLDTVALAEEYGNPLYVMDEDQIRRNCRVYTEAMRKYLPEGSHPLYAGKALCFKGLYPIIGSEGFGADVVSPGEIYTALAGGFDPANLFYHGTAKTDWDIDYAIDNHIGWFIVDNYNELEALDRIAGEKGIIQDILLRITVGIDPHTQEKINTGRIDSQFGVAVDTGQAAVFVRRSRLGSNAVFSASAAYERPTTSLRIRACDYAHQEELRRDGITYAIRNTSTHGDWIDLVCEQRGDSSV